MASVRFADLQSRRLLPISELAIPEGICYTRGPKE